MRIYWTEEETNFLIKSYIQDGMSVSEIYPIHILKYPFRTLTAIKIKIKKLKLRHTKEQTSDLKSRLNSGENNGMYGKVGPNSGLNKSNSDRIRISSEKISKTRIKMYKNGELSGMCGKDNPMYGKEPWMKGLTKYTDNRLKISGEKQSLNQKERWMKMSEFDKNKKIGELTLAANKAKKDTKIEIIIKDKLDEMKIEYIKNYRYNRFVFDFYLPQYNFVIECQGDYWHGNKEFFKILNEVQQKNIERDKKKTEYLKMNNIKSLFLWENEIYRNINNLKEIIWQQLIS